MPATAKPCRGFPRTRRSSTWCVCPTAEDFRSSMMGSTGRRPPRRRRHVLIIVENLPVPFDTRVWQEARALNANGYHVSVICPIGKGCEKRHETLEGVDIYRH